MVLNTNRDNFIIRKVNANILYSEELTLLGGEQTLMEWKIVLDIAEQDLGFKEQKIIIKTYLNFDQERKYQENNPLLVLF